MNKKHQALEKKMLSLNEREEKQTEKMNTEERLKYYKTKGCVMCGAKNLDGDRRYCRVCSNEYIKGLNNG